MGSLTSTLRTLAAALLGLAVFLAPIHCAQAASAPAVCCEPTGAGDFGEDDPAQTAGLIATCPGACSASVLPVRHAAGVVTTANGVPNAADARCEKVASAPEPHPPRF